MSASQIIRYSDINVNDITFGPLVKTKTGRKMVNVLHRGTPLVFQTPAMHSPYGLSEYKDEKTDAVQSIVFDGSFGTDSPDLTKFQGIMEGLEAKLLETASSSSVEWFGEDMDIPFMKKAKMFKSQIKKHPEGKYPPTLKIKIPVYDNKVQTKVYDSDRNQVDTDYIQKGAKVTSIVEIRSVWLIDNSFGVTIKAHQCKVQPNQRMPSYAFLEDEEASSEQPAEDEFQDY